MFFPDLKNTDIVAFVGKDGVGILSKALERVFAESHYNASDLIKSLHLKTRCLMAWLENISKNNVSLSQIPLTNIITETHFKDHVLSFIVNNKAVIHKREVSRFQMGNNIESVIEMDNPSLPEIASHLMNLEQYQDELDNSDFFNSSDLNKTIQILVDKHMDFMRKSVKLKLDKSEAQTICEDCGQNIALSTNSSKLCICYKFMGNNSIHIEKNDKGGLTLHFGKKWDQENIALFTRALKSKLK